MSEKYIKIIKILVIATVFASFIFPNLSTPAFAQPVNPKNPDPLNRKLGEAPKKPEAKPVTQPETETNKCEWWQIFCNIEYAVKWAINFILSSFLSIVGIFVSIAVSLIQTILLLTADVTASEIVTIGFKTTLSVANLGFVLALILIAFTTILRIEKYQLKQLLYRLIIAAILINFSLAIAGIILDFSNVISNFFIAGASPGSSMSDFNKFGADMANSLKIQNLTNIKDSIPVVGGFLDSAVDFLTNIFSLLMAVVFTILIFIVLLGIGLMLLIRYIYIVFLLILMPIAWLFWTIPQLSSLWSKWWSNFLKWALILPAMTFFLYLSMITFRGVDVFVEKSHSSKSIPSSDAANKYILQKDGLQKFLGLFVKLGLLVGTLVAANSIGIQGSETALGMAKGVKGWATGKMKNAGKGIGRGALRGTLGRLNRKGTEPGAKSRAEKVQDWASKERKGRLGGVKRYLAGQISRGIAGTAAIGETQESQRVKEAESKVGKMTEAQLLNSLQTGSKPTKVAALKKLTKDGKLNKVDMKRFITGDMKKTFANLGEGKAFSDMEKTAGVNVEMMDAMKNNDQTALNQASEAFIKGLSEEDKKKIQYDDIYKSGSAFGVREGAEKEMLQKSLSYGMSFDSGMIAKAMSKIKSKNLENFKEQTEATIQNLYGQAISDGDEKLATQAKNLRDSMNKNLDRRLIGFNEGESTPETKTSDQNSKI